MKTLLPEDTVKELVTRERENISRRYRDPKEETPYLTGIKSYYKRLNLAIQNFWEIEIIAA